jgi:hypothetical protein
LEESLKISLRFNINNLNLIHMSTIKEQYAQ